MEPTNAALADWGRAAKSAVGHLGLVASILTSALTWSGAAWPQGGTWPRSISIGTASPGGAYGAYGEGLARILTRTLQIEVTAQVTQGPAQNRSHARLRHHGRGLARLERYRVGEGNPLSLDACHIPDVRQRLSVRDAEAPCDQVARRFRRIANRSWSTGRHRGHLCP